MYTMPGTALRLRLALTRTMRSSYLEGRQPITFYGSYEVVHNYKCPPQLLVHETTKLARCDESQSRKQKAFYYN